jgi:hypothetical protein
MHPSERPWRTWYGLPRWRRIRRLQLLKEPLCRLCAQHDRATPAVCVDHVKSHQGDWNEFWCSEVQSLCANCHNSYKALIEKRGYDPTIGLDGWPTDRANHPCYRVPDRKR